jgi:heptaprenyl diphosphate synthase
MIEKSVKTDEPTKDISYEEAIELVHTKVDHTLTKAPIIIRKYTNHLVSSKSKFIRAKSLIICAEDKQGNIHPNAITLAAALEILHLATLVHDDVIDNADLRRGSITLQKKYGKKTAVICGDYLLCASLKMAASISNKEDYLSINFPDYMSKVCIGELTQHINNGNLDISMYQYFKIISGKTAALFDAAFYAGAYFSGSNEKELIQYKKLGYILGIIFQLTDDCLDFETTETVAMKSVQSDYEQGVITLPLIHALHEIAGFKDKAIRSELSRSEINDAVSRSGGLFFTRRMVQSYYSKALHLISYLDITENKKEKLISVLNQVARLSLTNF